MRRVVSLYLPTWATDRLRRSVHAGVPWDRPLVTAIQDGPRRVLAAVDRSARKLGLRPGMPLAQAQSFIVDLVAADATPDEDAAGLERLARWCIRYSPLVAPDPPDGVWIEIAGSAHLFKGEAALLSDLLTRIDRDRFNVRAAVADTPGAAWAVARFSRGEAIVAPGDQARAIAGLPVRALRLSPGVVEGLGQLGIERVGQLAAKPRAPLKLRFGDEVILRLDQALGHASEPIAYVQPREMPFSHCAFAEPISAPETIHRVVSDLLKALCADLERRCLGARRLDLVFVRVDNLRQGLRIGTAQPSRDPRHLMRLFAERLALVDPGFGIEEASLFASQAEWFDERQVPHPDLGGAAADDGLAELVDRLSVRLGATRLYRVAPAESEMPERSVRRIEPLAPPTGLTWPADWPRPARLLDPPEPVAALALTPDHPPASFVWRGGRHRVLRADGPERVFGEWWRSDDEVSSVRDYYRVEDERGARFWLFRDAPMDQGGRWWLHGIGEA